MFSYRPMKRTRNIKLLMVLLAGCYLQIACSTVTTDSGRDNDPVAEMPTFFEDISFANIPCSAKIVSPGSTSFTTGDAWAKNYEKRGLIELESGNYVAAGCFFKAGSSKAVDQKIKSILGFRQGFTLQQMALQATDSKQKMALLRDAEGSYSTFHADNPGAAAGANNLARVKEDIGIVLKISNNPAEAASMFAEADKLYQQAVDANDPRIGLYIKNYAEFLSRDGNWKKAQRYYVKLISGQVLSDDLRQSIEDDYASHGMLEEYLWTLLQAGYVQNAIGRAMDELENSATDLTQSNMSPIDLWTIVAAGLARSIYNPDEFQSMEIGIRINNLVEVAGVAKGAKGIAQLHDTNELKSDEFSWWAKPKKIEASRPFGLWPIEGFRALARSLGNRYKQSCSIGLAAKYFSLAVDIESESVDVLAIRDMVYMYAEQDKFDEVDRVIKKYEPLLFEYKNEAYQHARFEEIFSYHRTLGELYALIEQWGNSRRVTSAIFQLEHARTVDKAGKFTPHMVDLLATGYEIKGRTEEAVDLRFNKGREFLQAGDRVGACKVLTPLIEMDVTGSQMGADLMGLLRSCPESEADTDEDEVELERRPTCVRGTHEEENVVISQNTVSDYIGDNIRLGVAYTSEPSLAGEFFWNYLEDFDSATWQVKRDLLNTPGTYHFE